MDGDNLGTVIISVDLSYLQAQESETGSLHMIVDKETCIYPLNCSSETTVPVYEIWLEAGRMEFVKKMPYYIHFNYFREMDCYLLSALNVREIGGGLKQVRALILACVILVILFCIFLFGLINREMVRPLHQFNDTMRRIREFRKRHLQDELDLGGCAEIREIGRIRKMALVKDAPEIARMVVDMGAIFRYSTKGSSEVSLEEEISIIKAYIRIQQMRFQGKIEVCYFISEEVYSLKVIKMLLQPIVENSIFHGLERKSGEGCLYIGARKDGEKLVITVKDDGVG